MKRKQRSILSYKPIENREVILACEAIDYVKKQGYILINAKKHQAYIFLMFVICMLGVSI